MTTVIRGVLPYISTSTLKHAGGEATAESDDGRPRLALHGHPGLHQLQRVPGARGRHRAAQPLPRPAGHGDRSTTGATSTSTSATRCSPGSRGRRRSCGPAPPRSPSGQLIAEEQHKARGAGEDPIFIGIGISSGLVVYGPVGTGDRKDFTAIGDEVNLGPGLEGANKIYETKSLVTETVARAVHDSFLLQGDRSPHGEREASAGAHLRAPAAKGQGRTEGRRARPGVRDRSQGVPQAAMAGRREGVHLPRDQVPGRAEPGVSAPGRSVRFAAPRARTGTACSTSR